MTTLSAPYWTHGEVGNDVGAWNTVILGSVFLPGISTVKTVGVKRSVDIKKAKGKDGATMTDNGTEPATVEIDVLLPTEDDWVEWLRVLPKINPRRSGATREPMELLHPEPNLLGVRAVFVEEISGNAPTAKGGKSYRIRCREWFPEPKPVKKTSHTNAQPVATLYPSPTGRSDKTNSSLWRRSQEEQTFEPTGVDAIEMGMGPTARIW